MHTWSRVPLAALILALLGVALLDNGSNVSAQSPQRLFEAPGRPDAPPSERAVRPYQARKARLRLDLLEAEGFTLNLFDNAERFAQRTRVERPADDRFVWHGQTDDGGAVTFAVVRGVATGTVFLDGRSFEITADAGGEYDVVELNPAAFPTEDAPLDAPDLVADASASSGTVSALADGANEIDVMVLWTPAARNAVGGTQSAVESLVLAAVANANVAYTNSQVNARLRLVHAAEVSFAEGSISTDLSSLTTNGDGKLDVAHTLRQQYGADIVTLLGAGYAGQGYCGIGYLMQSATTSFATYAFNVVDQSCAAGNLSYAHEVGHNQGLQHDTPNAASTPSYPYAYGYQDPGGAFRTVMSYGGAPRVPYLSSPTTYYSGRVTGTSSQDNARGLNNTASVVASFKGTAGGGSTTPACSFSVSPTSLSFSSSVGSAVVSVSTTSGCSWSSSSNSSWAMASGSGSGSGSATVNVTSNSGSSRGVTVVVAGQSVTVSQEAAPAPAPPPPTTPACTYSVSPTSLSFGAAAESKVVTVTTQSGCAWTTASGTSWLSVTGGMAGSGSATVSASANTSGARSASVVVAGVTVSASQANSKGKGGGKKR